MEVKVFVIVVTYNGTQWYNRCFESLRHSSIPVQTIVVDNASKDGTVEYLKENFPEIYLITSQENLGFGRANNIGMRYALDQGCDFVFLLNQDTWIEPETVETLVNCHKNHPEYGIISPMQMNANLNHLNFLLDDGNRNCDFLSDLYCGIVKDLYPVSYVNAAAWLLPRNTLEKIGGFCPIIFHYGEDDDYLNRARFHRFKIGVCPAARIVHDTRNRIGESVVFFEKANLDKIDEYLDITKPVDLTRLRRYYLRKVFLSFVGKNQVNKENYLRRYRFIKEHQEEIEKCREQHKLLQPNWLR